MTMGIIYSFPKRHDPVSNLAQKVITPSKIWFKKVMTPDQIRLKSHDPVTDPLEPLLISEANENRFFHFNTSIPSLWNR